MKRKLLKAIQRTDWQNYLDPEDQKRIKDERTYRISSRLDAVVNANGEIALVLHQGHEYLADTTLSNQARTKLLALLQCAKGVRR
ncbi:MAG: hypothetical protein HYT79_02695 [Elusimicrobia bacterium]|nr:hypothetical protein [Elusimicrobiota bacterium]